MYDWMYAYIPPCIRAPRSAAKAPLVPDPCMNTLPRWNVCLCQACSHTTWHKWTTFSIFSVSVGPLCRGAMTKNQATQCRCQSWVKNSKQQVTRWYLPRCRNFSYISFTEGMSDIHYLFREFVNRWWRWVLPARAWSLRSALCHESVGTREWKKNLGGKCVFRAHLGACGLNCSMPQRRWNIM